MILNDFNINLVVQVLKGDTELFDKQEENYKNLVMSALHDNNSSTLRELAIMRYLGYESYSAKLGADGIDNATGTLIEVKPKYIQRNKKLGSSGNFNDLTMALLGKKKDYSIVCGAIYDIKLVYIVEFPMSVIYDHLKKPVETAKAGRRVVAHFGYKQYDNDLLKIHYLNEGIVYECLSKPHASMLTKRYRSQ